MIKPELVTSAVTPYLTGTTARVSIIPEVGHLLPYEAPQPIADALTGPR